MASLAKEELERRLAAAQRIVARSAEIVLGHLGQLKSYDQKSAIDFVTTADRESEAAIATALRGEFPDDRLVLEETDGKSGAIARRGEIEAAPFAWCVDPLDGTTSFVHTYPAFSVALGVLHFGQPVLGVVAAPASGDTYWGGQGVPAMKNGEPILVSRVEHLERALLGTGFPYDRRERLDALLALVKAALLSAQDLRRSGSASLDLCHLASGCLDGFFEQGLSPWDVAPGQAIIEAAGGVVTCYRGEPHDIFAGELVATNGRIHPELIAMIVQAGFAR